MESRSSEVSWRRNVHKPRRISEKDYKEPAVVSAEYTGECDNFNRPWLQPGTNHLQHDSTVTTNDAPIDLSNNNMKKDQARSTIGAWAFELLATIISATAIVAIILILHRENNKPLTSWNLAISLNTIISLLGTVSRTALAFALSSCIGQQKWSWLSKRPASLSVFVRFDEASRGPWGATRLFFWLKLRHWAALGAIAFIGTVAFDPFLQAVLSTYGRLDDVSLSTRDSISHALRVDGGDIIEVSSGAVRTEMTDVGYMAVIASIYTRPDFGIVSSIYNGFDSKAQTANQAVSFECSTGNCTWSNFVSTAVCSTCNDVSQYLEKSSGFGRNGSNVPPPSNIYLNASYTTFQLPYSNIKNFDGYSNFSGQSWYQYRYPPRTFMTTNTTFDVYKTMTFQKYETLLMAFTMIRGSDEYMNNKTSWEASRPVATECALYFCVKEFRSSSNSSVLQEEVVNSWAIRDQNSYKHDNGTARFSTGRNTDAWIEAQGNRLYHGDIDPPRYDLRLTVPSDKTGLKNVSNLNITHRFIRSTTEFLIDMAGGKDRPDVNFQEVLAFPKVPSTPIMDALWSSKNFTETFDNVARSLTNQLRTMGGNRFPGTVREWVIHVKVDWAYLSYLATMLVFGILYIGFTIAESINLNVPAWKERVLPTLLYGFPDEAQRLLREADDAGGKPDESTGQPRGEHLVVFKYNEREGCEQLLLTENLGKSSV